MKVNWNSKYTTIAVYTIIVILIALALIFLFFNFPAVKAFLSKINIVLKPIFYGLIFAYILNPLMEIFERRVFRFDPKKRNSHFKAKRLGAIICTYLSVLLLLTLFISLFVPQIGSSYMDLQSKFGTYIDNTKAWITSLADQYDFIAQIYSKITAKMDSFLADLISSLQTLAPLLKTYIAGFVVEVTNIFMGLILAFYLLYSKERLIAQIKKFTLACAGQESYHKIEKIAVLSDSKFGHFIVGKIVDSLILGLMCLISMWLLKLPYYPLISIIVCITNVIPIVGPFIGAIPSALIIFIADPWAAIEFVILIIILQQIESNIIEPRILGNSMGLSALWIIVSITIMGKLFGVGGMFISVPIFAVLYSLIKEFSEEKLKKENLPVSTLNYYTDPNIAALDEAHFSKKKERSFRDKVKKLQGRRAQKRKK